jgi:glucose-6-phosphate isomerase
LVKALGHQQFNLLEKKARRNAPRVHFADNADPHKLTQLLEPLDLKTTLVYVISRSGGTVETLVAFLWIAELLKKKVGKAALSTQVVIATDKEKSPLAEIAKTEKIDLLHIPANLAGRFGVLGNCGLFVAGMCGFNIEALLAGAGDMDKRCRHGDALNNPAYMHSLLHYLLTRKRRKTMHATYAFSNRLYAVAEWYGHFCAVSLGKMLNRKGKAVHVGPSPVGGVGLSDQHGQMQLYAEGPFDKVLTFLAAKDHGAKVSAPAAYPKIDGVGYLGTADCGMLMESGRIAAEQAITASGRPNLAIILDTIDEASIGGLYFLLQLSTTMSAELYGIDPFDQPGVEHNKQATYAQLGRSGFEDLAKKLTEYRKLPRRTC